MAVEVYKGTFGMSGYSTLHYSLLFMAESFSASSHFNIIDSYSTSISGQRYKGDPVADGKWNSSVDVNDNNSWLVVECITTRHSGLGLPNWQAKFQICGNGHNLVDPSDISGNKYRKYHLEDRYEYVRFAAFGGWDLADSEPDFVPDIDLPDSVLPSTENHGCYFGNADQHAFLIMDDGCLAYCCTDTADNYQFRYLSFVMGDVDPVSNAHMPMPRALLNGDTSRRVYTDQTEWLEANGYNSSWHGININSQGMSFYDNELNLIERGYRIWDYSKLLGVVGESQPNPYSSKLDLFPYVPMPYLIEKLWFTVPMLRIGFGIGTSLIDDKNWLSTVNNDLCVYLKWDGTSEFL